MFRLLGFLPLIGLICVLGAVGAKLPGLGADANAPLIAGLLVIFLVVPIVLLRHLLLEYIRNHLGKGGTLAVSYQKLAVACFIGAAAVSFVFSAALVAAGSFAAGYLVIAAVVAIGVGCLAYASIWFIWIFNGEQLAQRGHRW